MGLIDNRTGEKLLHAGAHEKDGSPGWFTTRLDAFVNWGRKNALWPLPYGTSCCGIEMMSTLASDYDLARFGAEAVRFSPRQADLLMCAGTITNKMAPVLKTIYDQMSDPKWVMAFGVCTSSGGIYNSYSVLQGIDTLFPVDVYVPGCPPSPEAVIHALIQLQKRIQRGDYSRRDRGGIVLPQAGPVIATPERQEERK